MSTKEERDDGLTVIELTTENVMRIVAASVRPDPSDPLVIVGGRNGQGKTALLESMLFALAGERSHSPEVLRRGAKNGSTTVILGTNGEPLLKVERRYTKKSTGLRVFDAAGNEMRGPQAILNRMFTGRTIDLMGFLRLPGPEQAAIVRQLAGVDTTELDRQRQEAYDKRTDIGREAKRLAAQLQSMPQHEDAPAEEVSVAELTDELERRQALIRRHDEERRAAAQAVENAAFAAKSVAQLDRRIEQLRRELAQAESEREDAAATATAMREAAAEGEQLAATLIDPDLDEVRGQLRNAEAVNRRVRENRNRASCALELEEAEGQATLLTKRIASIDGAKADMLAKAKLPLPGLGFDGDDLTLDGFPLSQASQSQQLALSAAVGFALHPQLRVLRAQDGSALDRESLDRLREVVKAHHGQLWLEKVSEDGQGCSVVIEDGTVRSEMREAG